MKGAAVAPELHALVHPYRTLAPREPEGAGIWLALRRPLLLLLVIGAMVSLTTARRLVVGHVAWAMIGWAFLPALEALAVALTRLVFGAARAEPLAQALDRWFLSRAPWLVFLAAFTVLHLTLGDPHGSFFSVFLRGPMVLALVACLVWSRLIEHAFWRGLGLSRWRALMAVALTDVLVLGPGLVWYLATEQLQPLVGATP